MPSMRLALLNTGRNWRRTLLILALIAVSTSGLIINNGLIVFIFDGLRDDAIYGRFGHLQIYKQGYREHYRQDPSRFWIAEEDYRRLRERLLKLDHVKAVTAEFTLPVLVVAGGRTATGIARGTDTGQERLFSTVRVVASLPTLGLPPAGRQVLLGRGMAERLHASPGDVVTLLATLPDRSYNALDAEVAGIFEEGFRDYDDWSLKTPLETLQQLAGEQAVEKDRKSTRLNSSHLKLSRMPSSA